MLLLLLHSPQKHGVDLAGLGIRTEFFYKLLDSDSESMDGKDAIGGMKEVEIQGTFCE